MAPEELPSKTMCSMRFAPFLRPTTASECKHFYRHDLRLGKEIIFGNSFVRMEISLDEVNYIYLATILPTKPVISANLLRKIYLKNLCFVFLILIVIETCSAILTK